jgi:hypothetical protein
MTLFLLTLITAAYSLSLPCYQRSCKECLWRSGEELSVHGQQPVAHGSSPPTQPECVWCQSGCAPISEKGSQACQSGQTLTAQDCYKRGLSESCLAASWGPDGTCDKCVATKDEAGDPCVFCRLSGLCLSARDPQGASCAASSSTDECASTLDIPVVNGNDTPIRQTTPDDGSSSSTGSDGTFVDCHPTLSCVECESKRGCKYCPWSAPQADGGSCVPESSTCAARGTSYQCPYTNCGALSTCRDCNAAADHCSWCLAVGIGNPGLISTSGYCVPDSVASDSALCMQDPGFVGCTVSQVIGAEPPTPATQPPPYDEIRASCAAKRCDECNGQCIFCGLQNLPAGYDTSASLGCLGGAENNWRCPTRVQPPNGLPVFTCAQEDYRVRSVGNTFVGTTTSSTGGSASAGLASFDPTNPYGLCETPGCRCGKGGRWKVDNCLVCGGSHVATPCPYNPSGAVAIGRSITLTLVALVVVAIY